MLLHLFESSGLLGELLVDYEEIVAELCLQIGDCALVLEADGLFFLGEVLLLFSDLSILLGQVVLVLLTPGELELVVHVLQVAELLVQFVDCLKLPGDDTLALIVLLLLLLPPIHSFCICVHQLLVQALAFLLCVLQLLRLLLQLLCLNRLLMLQFHQALLDPPDLLSLLLQLLFDGLLVPLEVVHLQLGPLLVCLFSLDLVLKLLDPFDVLVDLDE